MITMKNFDGYAQIGLRCGDMELETTELGAAALSLRWRGRETLLRYGRAEDYLKGTAYLCAAIGRYANRIGGARFSLNGREYALPANEGRNQLHGGPDSYDKRRWDWERAGENAVRFSLLSPDGDNGYPGNLRAWLTYTLKEDALRMDFEGLCDADTVYAPTGHLYFDLSGRRAALDHELWLNTGRYVEVDGENIPTGRLLPAEGAFDFRRLRKIGRDYDHCFALEGSHACTLRAGGLSMELHTDFPGVQIYTGAFLGAPFGKNGGLAIEPEFFPDSPNRPEFPSAVLRAGERFHRYAEFRFAEA